jgi:hypothetical protein
MLGAGVGVTAGDSAGGVAPVAGSVGARRSQPAANNTVNTAAARTTRELFGNVFIMISFQGIRNTSSTQNYGSGDFIWHLN